MNNSVTSRNHSVKYVEGAIEYGTLALLMESLIQQPVLVMPLERTIQHGSVTILQWMVHITTRTSTNSPIAYATLPAAEVRQTDVSSLLIYPPHQPQVPQDTQFFKSPETRMVAMQYAQQFQRQLQECIITMLKSCPQVSQIVAPARYRLPDEWVWSARGTDERIVCRDGAWTLLEEGQNHV